MVSRDNGPSTAAFKQSCPIILKAGLFRPAFFISALKVKGKTRNDTKKTPLCFQWFPWLKKDVKIKKSITYRVALAGTCGSLNDT